MHVQRLQLVLRLHVAAERLRLVGRGHRPRRRGSGRRRCTTAPASTRSAPSRPATAPTAPATGSANVTSFMTAARRGPRRHPSRSDRPAAAGHVARARGARGAVKLAGGAREVGRRGARALHDHQQRRSARSPSTGSGWRCADPPAPAPTWSPTRPLTLAPGQPLAVTASWPLDTVGRWHGWIEVVQRRRAQPRRREAGLRLPRESRAEQIVRRWILADAGLSSPN